MRGLPRLQRRWPAATARPAADAAAAGAPRGGGRDASAASKDGSRRADRFGLTPTERLRIWKQASLAAARATEQIAASAASDPASAADAAWAASDFLAAAGRVVEGRRSGPLTDAADQYDLAAREMFRAAPRPATAGHGLRAAGRLLLAAHVAKPSETRQLLALLAQLAALADAVTRLRETQQRAAQAAAVRAAAEQLRVVERRYLPPGAIVKRPAAAAANTVRGRAAARVSAPVDTCAVMTPHDVRDTHAAAPLSAAGGRTGDSAADC